MKYQILRFKKHPFLFVFGMLLLTSCATISRFDEYAYTQVTSVKVDALAIMDSATIPYVQCAISANQVLTSLSKMYEYERNRPKDQITVKMIGLLQDSSGHLFGGFIKRWQKEGTLDAAFIAESKNIIGLAFDQISQLESGKIKPSQIPNTSNN